MVGPGDVRPAFLIRTSTLWNGGEAVPNRNGPSTVPPSHMAPTKKNELRNEKRYDHGGHCYHGMPAAATTVPVRPETLRKLKSYKVGGVTYDDVLNELMEEVPPPRFWREHYRRLHEEVRLPLSEVRRRLKL